MAKQKTKLLYDLSKHVDGKNRAVFLPSVSCMYVTSINRSLDGLRPVGLSPVLHPDGTLKSLDYINYVPKKQDDWLFYWPYNLYSAGHARLDPAESQVKEPMIQNRDRAKTVILGDSGGFQIATGVFKVDWESEAAMQEMRESILRWLEYSSTYAMILDFPTASCFIPNAIESILVYDFIKQGNKKRMDWMYVRKDLEIKLNATNSDGKKEGLVLFALSEIEKLNEEQLREKVEEKFKEKHFDVAYTYDDKAFTELLELVNKYKALPAIVKDTYVSKKDSNYKYYSFCLGSTYGGTGNKKEPGYNPDDPEGKWSYEKIAEDFFPIVSDATYENNMYFQNNRKNYDMQFLNVVQGQNPHQVKEWIERMKDFKFEGWSTSGTITANFYLLLHAIYYMHKNGCLSERVIDGHKLSSEWLHLLGHAKLKAALAFTILQRKLREHVNPNITVSFDAASAFLTAARGNFYTGWNKGTLKMAGRSFLDSSAGLVGSSEPFNLRSDVLEDSNYTGGPYLPDTFEIKPGVYDANIHRHKLEFKKKYSVKLDTKDVLVSSPIVEKMTYGDLCVLDNKQVETKARNLGEFHDDVKFKKDRTYDSLSYVYMMNHNVYALIEAIYQAHDLYDSGEYKSDTGFNGDIIKDLELFERCVDMIFDDSVDFEAEMKKPEYEEFLVNYISNNFAKNQGAKKETTFSDFFAFDAKEETPTEERDDIDGDEPAENSDFEEQIDVLLHDTVIEAPVEAEPVEAPKKRGRKKKGE